MSENVLKLERKDFCCRVCSELPREPVTLPCGHSFCLDCVQRHWDREEQPTCPQCRHTFPRRPPLCKNAMLEALMAQLNATAISPEAEHCPEEITCDVCPVEKLKAVKSCLKCKASNCDKHLQLHYNVPQFQKHTLVEPRDSLEENCSDGDEEAQLCSAPGPHHEAADGPLGSNTSSQPAAASTSGPRANTSTSTSLFSGTNKGNKGGLFFETNSAFGANMPEFCGSFGSSSGGLFCPTNTTSSPLSTTSSLFRGSAFNNERITGVILKYIPLTDSETVEEGSSTFSSSTGLHSSSAPKTSFSFRKTNSSNDTKGFGASTRSQSGQNPCGPIFKPFSQTSTTQSTSLPIGNTASTSQAKSSTGLSGRTAPAQSGGLIDTAQTSKNTQQSLFKKKTTGSRASATSVLSSGTGNKTTLTDMSTSSLGCETNTDRGDLPKTKPATGGSGAGLGAGDTEHEVSLPKEDRVRLEKELEERRQIIKMRIEQKEAELEELRRTAADVNSSADAALKLNNNTFTEMMTLMKEKKKSAEQEIRCKDHILRFGIQYLLDYVKEDIAFWEQQKKERKAVLRMRDPFDVFRKCLSLPLVPPPHLARLVDPDTTAFRKLQKRPEIPMKVNHMCYFYHTRVDDEEQPKFAREGYLNHWRKITWDADTAHRNVSLEPTGGGNPCAVFSTTAATDVPDHPDRFSDCVQVLSKEPLTGRCYFEVCPTSGCFVGLAYKSVERKGRGTQCVLGLNDKSWACFGGGFKYKGLNNSDTWVLCPDVLNRVGVYLNQEAGTVTFFLVRGSSLCDVHVVEARFTEPLYFGALFLYPGDRIWIPNLKDKPVR